MQSRLILLAEDNLVNQKVAVRQLEKLGYQAHAVANGCEALAALDAANYDLVLMDCQMPVMDGYEAVAEIRRREGANKHTLIVAMTAHAMIGDREKCLAAGMDDYLSKPVRHRELEALLNRVFARSTLLTDNEERSDKTIAPVDFEQLRDVRGKDLAEILDLYLAGMTKDIEKLAAAIQANCPTEVELIAHSCAGTSATCGMTAVVPAFRSLEELAREGSLNQAPARLAVVQRQFARIRSFLEIELGTLPAAQ